MHGAGHGARTPRGRCDDVHLHGHASTLKRLASFGRSSELIPTFDARNSARVHTWARRYPSAQVPTCMVAIYTNGCCSIVEPIMSPMSTACG